MRILAIRGRNLASLEREFAIELEEDPLAQAGLFAICGPTGAGKSTILDALCVALFDKTPRLDARGGVPIGRAEQPEADRLVASDVRGILRHGTTEGFAEVDFIGRDSRRYRARWDVWRAYRKPAGRVQPQTMSLADIETGKVFGSNKSETLEAIESKLGLSFQQFRRSALLAQGEFAAFLRADTSARSELLERMTGTEIYGVLSKAAFERNKSEARALESLRERISQYAVLSDAEREALEAERHMAGQALAQAESELAEAEAAYAWHGRLAELAAAEAEAKDALESAEARWREAEPLRETLRRVARARAFRAVVTAAERCRQRLAQAEETLVADERSLAALCVQAQECRARRDAAERGLAEARAEESRAAPLLAEASALDTELLYAQRAVASAQDDWQAAARNCERAEIEHRRLSDAAAAAQADHDRALAWREDNAWMEVLAAQWPRWQSALDRYIEAAERCRKLMTAADTLADADHSAAAELALARRHCDSEKAALDRARGQADRAQRAADKAPLSLARQSRDAAEKQREALRELGDVARRAAAARETIERLTQAAAAQRRAHEEAMAAHAAHASAMAGLRADMAEAERELGRLRLARELSAHRSELRHGEACPLCGASEHPWADRNQAEQPGADPIQEDAQVARAEEQVDVLRARERQAADMRTKAESAAEEALRRAGEAEAELAGARQALDASQRAWRAALTALEELPLHADPAHPSALEWAQSRLVATQAKVAELTGAEARAAGLEEAARLAHSKVAICESNFFQARAILAEKEERARTAVAAAAEHALALAQARAEMSEVADALTAADLGPPLDRLAAPAAPSFHALLAREPKALRTACERACAAWLAKDRALTELRIRLAALACERDAKAFTLAEHRERERALDGRRADLQCQHAALLCRREALLGGRATSALRDELAAAVSRHESAAESAREADHGISQSLAKAMERAEAAERMRAQAHGDLSRAEADLADACVRAELPPDQLRALSAHSDEWLAAHEQTMQELASARAHAETVLSERASQRWRHEASGWPRLTQEAALDAVTAARRARIAAAERASELVAKLRVDDEAQKRRAEVTAQALAQHKRAALYQTLSDLIGSHDGKKFRVFAQSLTLDTLLGYANRHLVDLAGRYRLVRVPGYDLDLQIIDRDMGDEVRSVHSLSGGESFLVSLALALGLSSLAARDTKVESLLIDEGFGSLDPATLETALAVLDALQAQGRKVGLISHVPGLAERVGVRIVVRPQGGGRSVIRVIA